MAWRNKTKGPFLLYCVNRVVMLTSIFKAKFPLEKEGGLYQNKVAPSLTFTQRLGHQAYNCKMGYSRTSERVLTTTENTITYHNVLCLSRRNFA